ncbi:hypothetical protein ACSMXN_15280 [Jatrophihabitans sp. DSM 45814]
MAAESSAGQLERWVNFAATIVAPATVLSGLLFYFGYVSSRAQFDYFGVDVDTIGLSTRDYVMRSPQPLLVPLLALTLLGIGLLRLHAGISRRIGVVASRTQEAPRLARYRARARQAVWAGLGMLFTGIVLLLSYPYLREWGFFNLVTPLVLAAGAALVAYTSRIQTVLRPRPPTASAEDAADDAIGEAARAHADRSMVALRRSGSVLIFVVIVANIFWATATIAQWSGRGLAHYQANHLDRLPSVILDTHERLFLRDPGVEETVLPASQGQTFHYRYRHLRLLIEGDNRMFLVPDRWSASDSTLVVPLSDSVRVQYQFKNEAP